MKYPIFNSLINKINGSLNKRKINVKKFRTWEENKINATGLEITIDLSETTNHMSDLSINFDWDRFREAALAQKMVGMKKHPFLKLPQLVKTSVPPMIDIEVVWSFNVDKCQPAEGNGNANSRIESARKWMEVTSREVNDLLRNDDIITRWHIEIEGDEKGKYLTTINLISYFQYEFEEVKSLNNAHKFVERKLQYLLYKANRVIRVADKLVDVKAA